MKLRDEVASVPLTSWEGDPILHVSAYRIALQLGAAVHELARCIDRDESLRGIGAQLARAVGSIGGNIAEGYGRRSGPDRARYLEYALGSAREARHWLFIARNALTPAQFDESTGATASIARLLLKTLPNERKRTKLERPSD